MADKTQMLKGVMEGVILKIIDKEENYGYSIYIKLRQYGFTEFSEGSLYPLLLRLEKKKLIKAVKKPSPFGPSRKYYSLTEEGLEEMNSVKILWDEISKNIVELWKQQDL